MLALIQRPVQAQTAFDPDLSSKPVYIRCGANKISAQSAPLSWSSAAPTESYQDGGGCEQITSHVLSGEFTGNINQLTVRAWVLDSGVSRATDNMIVEITASVDGRVLIPRDTLVLAEAVAGNAPGARLFTFTIENVGLLDETDNVRHQISLTMQGSNGRPADEPVRLPAHHVWTFDAEEFPSGIVFNGAEKARTVVSAVG
jgi:hypothetical protein